MNVIANRDGIGSSKFELWLFKLLHALTFKKFRCLTKIIDEIEEDIVARRNKHV